MINDDLKLRFINKFGFWNNNCELYTEKNLELLLEIASKSTGKLWTEKFDEYFKEHLKTQSYIMDLMSLRKSTDEWSKETYEHYRKLLSSSLKDSKPQSEWDIEKIIQHMKEYGLIIKSNNMETKELTLEQKLQLRTTALNSAIHSVTPKEPDVVKKAEEIYQWLIKDL